MYIQKLLLAICFLILTGCSSVKQVLRSPEKTMQVAWEYIKRQPVMPSDTVVRLVKGDSVIQIITNSDTAYVFDSLYIPVERVITKYQTKYITRVDTVTRTVVDRTLLSEYQKQGIAQQVAIDQLKKDKDELLASRNKFRLWLWLLTGGIGLIGIISIVLKLKK